MTLGRRRYGVYALLTVATAIGLYFSHRFAYRWGAWTSGRPAVLSYIRDDEDADALNLHYNVLALRVYVRHPEAASVNERIVVCSLARMQADMVEQRVIPRLQQEGRADEADRLAERLRDPRDLIAAVDNKQKG